MVDQWFFRTGFLGLRFPEHFRLFFGETDKPADCAKNSDVKGGHRTAGT